ncbi:phosphotriesterase [Nostocoides sp. HKS02]|uniref:phosphotriesterase family protein n=1 Tax=Nostocoides sp. HKS02 TaxID=1813880 RepID=UPI0012B4AFB8|nr:hypothetical protein [Tetrasphaera sp. HKS02]QGN58813.1 hypothetical protein GKE56_14050 [Tetrasphaera sp. HKS02]
MTAVQTTSGPVQAEDLGIVLPHEHIFINELSEDRANGLLNDHAVMAAELAAFASVGGTTLVELTTAELTAGASPDPRGLYGGASASGCPDGGSRSVNNVLGLADLARQTGVNVVLGTGHYRDPYLSADPLDRHGVDTLAERIMLDLTEGFPGTSVRAGVIGEVGADKWFVSAREERSIRAAARAQVQTGVAVTTHASKWPVGGDLFELLTAEGVAPDRIIIGHCSTIDLTEYHLDLASRGAYVQFDTLRGGPPMTVQRSVRQIMALVSAGYLGQVLLSQDVCLKDHLRVNGGCGYTYLLTDFLPLLVEAGLDPAEVDQLVRANPQRALCS